MRHSIITAALAISLAFSGTALYAQDNTLQEAAKQAAGIYATSPDVEKPKPKPNYWTPSAKFDFGLTNTALTDWAAGGYDQVTLKTSLDATANYAKDLTTWNNRLQLDYGFLWSKDKEDLLQKNVDNIYLQTQLNFKTKKESTWSFSVKATLRSQFSPSYNYKTPAEGQTWKQSSVMKSAFMAPGYPNLALGMSWKPMNWLSFDLAPLTADYTIVRVESLRKNYGMELKDEYADVPAAERQGYMYRRAKFQFGANITGNLKIKFNDNINFDTQVTLFTNYLKNPGNFRVNWDNKFVWQIARFLNLTFQTWLIYDPDVLIVSQKDADIYPSGRQRVQLKEVLSLNFTYTFKK